MTVLYFYFVLLGHDKLIKLTPSLFSLCVAGCHCCPHVLITFLYTDGRIHVRFNAVCEEGQSTHCLCESAGKDRVHGHTYAHAHMHTV